jgi:PhoD-like phosphatase, N-terminal domain
LATTLLFNTLVFYYPSYAVQVNNLAILNGVASGDSTDNSNIVWSRANRDSFMHVQYTYNNSHFSNSDPIVTVPANASSDFTGHAKLTALKPNTNYHYVVWFSLGPNPSNIKFNRSIDFPGWRNIPGNFSSVNDVNWTDETQLHNVYLKHWEYNRNDHRSESLRQYINVFTGR